MSERKSNGRPRKSATINGHLREADDDNDTATLTSGPALGKHTVGRNGKVTASKSKVKEEMLTLGTLRREKIIIPIIGTEILIMSAWSEKAKRMMLDAQMQKTPQKKEAKDPEADFNAARYRTIDGRDGVPAHSFKAAIVSACRFFDKKLTLVQTKTAIFIDGVLSADGSTLLVPLEIEATQPTMRQDMVRLNGGTADIRHRPQYWPWAATLNITYYRSVVPPSTLLDMVSVAGDQGIGEWRPSAPKVLSGTFGRFRIDLDRMNTQEDEE